MDSIFSVAIALVHVLLAAIALGTFKAGYGALLMTAKQAVKNVPPLGPVNMALSTMVSGLEEALGSPVTFKPNFTHVLLFAVLIQLLRRR